MSEATLNGDESCRRPNPPRAASVLRRLRTSDLVFHGLTRAAALCVLLLLGGVILSLIIGSAPALSTFGLGFITTEVWNPVTDKFGALAPIYGTLVTSLIAMLIAVPVGFGIAFFLTELCPPWLRRPIGIAIELLAGIPSIIYGIWGLFVFAPFLQQYIQPFLIDTFGNVPVLGSLFAGPPYGIGMLTAGLILAIMVLPFITAIIARRVRDRAAGAQGSRLRPRLHDLGGDLQRRPALHARRRGRRHHAGPRPRARRDHGGHLRDRQRAHRSPPRSWRRARPSRPRSPTSSPRRSATSTPPR